MDQTTASSVHQGKQTGLGTDAQNALKDLFAETLQEMLEALWIHN
jgi:hypothetical protein